MFKMNTMSDLSIPLLGEESSSSTVDEVMRNSSPKMAAAGSPAANLAIMRAVVDDDQSEVFQVNQSNFQLIRILGSGNNGRVYLARKLDGIDKGQLYAMKIMKRSMQSMNELKMMKTLNGISPYFVNLHYSFPMQQNLCLVMDFVQGGDLFSFLKKSEKPLTQNTIKNLVAEIFVAIRTLHNMSIYHGDIKLGNILLSAEGHIVLCDFGLCRHITNRYDSCELYGTLPFMAPEIIQYSQYCRANDFWALGICIVILFGQPHPFQISYTCDREDVDRRLEKRSRISKEINSTARSLINCLLKKDPKERMRWVSLHFERHSFFKGISWEKVRRQTHLFTVGRDLLNELDLKHFRSSIVSADVFGTTDSYEHSFNRDCNSNAFYVAPALRFHPEECPSLRMIYLQRIIQSASYTTQNKFFKKYQLSSDCPIGFGRHFLALKCHLRINPTKVFCVKVSFVKNTCLEKRMIFHYQNYLDKIGNVVTCEDVLEDNGMRYIVSELLEGGPILNRIYRKEEITESEIKVYFKHIVYAVQQLDKLKLFHSNLTPQKCMFKSDDKYTVKLINFTAIRKIKTKSDVAESIVSLGVVLYTMLCRKSPFILNGNGQLVQGMIDTRCTAFKVLSREAKCFLKNLLTKPMTLNDVENDEWMQKPIAKYPLSLVKDVHDAVALHNSLRKTARCRKFY